MQTYRPSNRASVLDRVRQAAGVSSPIQQARGVNPLTIGSRPVSAPVSAPEAAIPSSPVETGVSGSPGPVAPVQEAPAFGSGSQWDDPFGGGSGNGDSSSRAYYAKGGMVGPDGMAIRPGVALGAQPAQAPNSPDMVQSQIRDTVTRAPPEVKQQVQQAVQQALQSGELTVADLQTAARLAKVVLADPKMYPQIRAFAIQHGMAEEGDLPPQYDQGLVYAILMAAEAVAGMPDAAAQGGAPQGGNPAGPGQPPQAGPPLSINVHGGEYVVPKHVVAMKGKDFFDKLVAQYDQKPEGVPSGT